MESKWDWWIESAKWSCNQEVLAGCEDPVWTCIMTSIAPRRRHPFNYHGCWVLTNLPVELCRTSQIITRLIQTSIINTKWAVLQLEGVIKSWYNTVNLLLVKRNPPFQKLPEEWTWRTKNKQKQHPQKQHKNTQRLGKGMAMTLELSRC